MTNAGPTDPDMRSIARRARVYAARLSLGGRRAQGDKLYRGTELFEARAVELAQIWAEIERNPFAPPKRERRRDERRGRAGLAWRGPLAPLRRFMARVKAGAYL